MENNKINNTNENYEKVLDLIPEGSSIGWGGSMSIRDMGLTKAIHEGNYTVIDRDLAKSPEETYEMQQTEFDNSEFCIRGDLTVHTDGTCTVKMGKPTDLEDAYEMLYGGVA